MKNLINNFFPDVTHQLLETVAVPGVEMEGNISHLHSAQSVWEGWHECESDVHRYTDPSSSGMSGNVH